MGAAVQTKLIAWAPFSKPQQDLVRCPVDEIFFGGARGGGKTDGMLGKFALKQKRYGKDAIGVFFRKTREDLKEAVERSKDIYGPLGASYSEQKKQWVFQTGARLKFEYLERDKDAENYQGHSYTDLFFEELTHWASPAPINKLRATLRSGAGVPCQFHATGNPGGPGHQWVKARYIDPAPNGYEVLYEDYENPFTGEVVKASRVFIPSKLTDNPTLMADPTYVAKLYQSGSKELVRAWLYGDWDIVEGAYFDCWEHDKHVIRPFEIPEHWLRFRSMDWGSAKPFSVGWWAVASEDAVYSDVWIPKGALVRYREWYGASAPDVGMRLTSTEVARGIREREEGEKISYGVLDPAAFAVTDGPSIAERMLSEKVMFRRADNRRSGKTGAMVGWDSMRARMKGEDFGEPMGERPMMYVFSTCKDFIRTVPVLQHDENRPEDLDTTQEDHCFTGDTLVSTTKGLYTLSELAGSSGFVWSADGAVHAYRSARMTRRNAKIVKLTFDDGATIRCTPDHRFLTTEGWKQARDLLSSSLTPFKSLPGSDTGSVGAISSGEADASTALCGKRTTAPFLSGLTSITRMVTGPITRSRIWRACRDLLTSACMAMSGLTSLGKPLPAFVTRQWSGTVATRGVSGIRNITRNIVPLRFTLSSIWNAAIAAQPTLESVTPSSVPTSASLLFGGPAGQTTSAGSAWFADRPSPPTDTRNSEPVPVSAVRPPAAGRERVCLSVDEAGRADVYCLTVPDTGNFVLANGAIVSNCADEARYACMSRPYTRPTPGKKPPVHHYKGNGENMTGQVPIIEMIRRKERRANE